MNDLYPPYKTFDTLEEAVAYAHEMQGYNELLSALDACWALGLITED